jgi:hypothetical protein
MLAAAFWFQHHTWGGKGMFQALFIFMFFFAGAMSLRNTPSNMTAAKDAQRQVGTII